MLFTTNSPGRDSGSTHGRDVRSTVAIASPTSVARLDLCLCVSRSLEAWRSGVAAGLPMPFTGPDAVGTNKQKRMTSADNKAY